MGDNRDHHMHPVLFRNRFPFGKRLPLVFLAFSLAFLLAGPAPGSAVTAVPSRDADRQEELAAATWDRYREALERNEWPGASEELEKLYQWRLDQGIANHLFFSSALIRETGSPSVREDPERISAVLNYAEKLAPYFSEVKFARADFLWSHPSPGNLARGLWEYGRGVYLRFANPGEAVAMWANAGGWVLLAFFLTFSVFSVSLLLRFYRFFVHHLGHLLPGEMKARILYPLSILLLFSPLWIGLPWMWLAGLWFLIFGVYAGRGDRIVMIALVLLLFLLPSGLRTYSAVVNSVTKNGVPELAAAQYGAWSVPLYGKLLALREKNPGDGDILASVALVEKRMGRYQEAEGNLREALRLSPGDPALYNNLGNVYLATNRTTEAMEAYRRAAELKPKSAVPLYNLGQANLLTLRLNEAEAEFRRAREVEPDLVSYYTGIASRTPNRQAVDLSMEPSRFWKRIVRSGGDRGIGQIFWEEVWAGTPLRFGEWTVAVLAILLALVFKITRRGRPIAACDRCGRLICGRCARSRVLGNQCSQCLHALAPEPTRADPETVKGKRVEVMRFREKRRVQIARLSFVLPGSGHLFGGPSWEGTLYVFIFFLFLAKAACWQGFVGVPFGPGVLSDIPGKLLAGVLFLLFYVWVQVRVRRGSKGGELHFRPS
jgi:tetratricopeptide (TPR) repeat protein